MVLRRLALYNRLGTKSKAALKRTMDRFGRPVTYIPRDDLLQRLMTEFNISAENVIDELLKDQELLLKLEGKENRNQNSL